MQAVFLDSRLWLFFNKSVLSTKGIKADTQIEIHFGSCFLTPSIDGFIDPDQKFLKGNSG